MLVDVFDVTDTTRVRLVKNGVVELVVYHKLGQMTCCLHNTVSKASLVLCSVYTKQMTCTLSSIHVNKKIIHGRQYFNGFLFCHAIGYDIL